MKNITKLLGDPSGTKSPKFTAFLSNSKIMAPVWTAMRVWLGIMWLQAGWAKLFGAENGYFMHNNGAGVAGFAAHGVASYSWWASFLHSFVVPNAGWIGVLITVAEALIGIGLILGILTPAAALGALILNLTYMFTGSAGVNPFYALFAVVILATWRTSGWIGGDGLIRGYVQRRRASQTVGLRQGVRGAVEPAQAA